MNLFAKKETPAESDPFRTPNNTFDTPDSAALWGGKKDPEPTIDEPVWGTNQTITPPKPEMSLKMVSLAKYPEDAKTVVGFVMDGYTILANAEAMDTKDFIRWVDYTAGAVQVLGATLKRQGQTKTFVLAPKGVDVSSLESI